MHIGTMDAPCLIALCFHHVLWRCTAGWHTLGGGEWGAELGMRIKQLPAWVATPHMAELASVVDSVRLSAYRGDIYLKLYGGNLSSLLSAVHGRAATMCSVQNQLLPQLQHTVL